MYIRIFLLFPAKQKKKRKSNGVFFKFIGFLIQNLETEPPSIYYKQMEGTHTKLDFNLIYAIETNY